MEQQHLARLEARTYCRINGHSFEYSDDELGDDGMYEVYVCMVCDKVNYVLVAD